jgi:hypothetical protein
VCRLDIVRVVVSSRSAHPAGLTMLSDDLRVVGGLFVTDRAATVLLSDFLMEKNPHGGAATALPETSRMVRIYDAPHSRAYRLPADRAHGLFAFEENEAYFAGEVFSLSAATKIRPVDRA